MQMSWWTVLFKLRAEGVLICIQDYCPLQSSSAVSFRFSYCHAFSWFLQELTPDCGQHKNMDVCGNQSAFLLLAYSDFCIDINQAPAGCKKESISLKKEASPWQPFTKVFCFTNISLLRSVMKWCFEINRHCLLQDRVRYRFQAWKKCAASLSSPGSLLWDWQIISHSQQIPKSSTQLILLLGSWQLASSQA